VLARLCDESSARNRLEALERAGKTRFETELLPHSKKSVFRARWPAADDAHLTASSPRAAGAPASTASQASRPPFTVHGPAGHGIRPGPAALLGPGNILRDKEGLDENGTGPPSAPARLDLLGPGLRASRRARSPKASSTLRKAPLMRNGRDLQSLRSQGHPLVAALHSRKCVYAGSSARQNLLQAAHLNAGKMGLPEPEGPPLVLG